MTFASRFTRAAFPVYECAGPSSIFARPAYRNGYRKCGPVQPPIESMNVHPDELDPPFEILEPAELRGPVAFNSPH